MGNSVQLLKVLDIGFWVCLALAIVFLLISILLFWKFNIREIIQLRSGKAQAKAIREKQEQSARSGKLRKGAKRAPELEKSGALTQPPQQTAATATQDAVTEKSTPAIQTPSQQFQDGTELTSALSIDDMKVNHGKFQLERQIIYIHTEEKI